MNAIELFGCAGGMSLGFRRAGIEFAWSFDRDPDACASYAANIGHAPVQLDVSDLLRMVVGGWSPGPLDLLVADPPCTPWSRAGKREGLNSDEDMLSETCVLIGELRPRCWLIGNVPGLDDSNNAGAVDSTIGSLRAYGYAIDFARLNASSYGVPQHRIRPFWFGRPSNSAPIVWPQPTHGDPANLGLPGIGLLPWVTCRDALQHLTVEELGRPVRLRWKRDTDHKTAEPDAPALTRNPNGDGSLLAHVDGHPPSRPDAPAYTITTGDRGGSEGGGLLLASDKHPHSKADAPSHTIAASQPTNGGAVLEWPWACPSTTVTRDERIPPPGHHPESGSILSQPNAVVLSEKARAILQGFPEGWVFCGKTKRSRSSQIGMAMPPAMAQAVATSIRVWFAAHAAESRAA